MSKNTYEALTTEYEAELDKKNPWGDYPRPLMRRESFLSLNGEWDFAVGGDVAPEEYDERILVPFPPESRLSGIGRGIGKHEMLYYRREVDIPGEMLGGRLLLHFGAVDQIAWVKVNGVDVGYHEGGYLPFTIDITEVVRCGKNEIAVRVKDELDRDYPYGKQRRDRGGMWYTPVSGIWQSVWLEGVSENYIKKLKIKTTMSEVRITVEGGEEKKRLLIDGGECIEFTGDTVAFKPEGCECWTPENPRLYGFTLTSGTDSVESYFALREIGVREIGGVKRMTLNGEPYLFNGLLDQGYYPDGIYLPATSRGYEDDILRMKALGFNTLRKHIKIEPEIFYHLCDRLGMVVFQDMVNNSGYSFIFDTVLPTVGMKRFDDRLLHRKRRSREIFIESMMGTVEHLDSYPSILYYTVFNEGWGQFCADENYARLKSVVPDKIVDATSGWFARHDSDVESHHVYFKPIKLSGDATDRPIVISEFGGYSHRVEGHLFGKENYGYSICGTREEFEDSFVKLYSGEVAEAIDRGASAFVYTQVSDVEDETNGILTYDRKICKLNAERIRPIMESLNGKIKSN